MKKKWVVKEKAKEVVKIADYPPLVLNLLANRGLDSEQKIKEFLNPDFEKMYDPFLFKDMVKAVERILKAIEQKEKIVIYSDYDADAITALSVMYLALKKLGANLGYYIPDRFSEGYGMNSEAVAKICEEGAKVIITVDCGINAVEEVETAKKFGVDVIITDHHELTGKLPDAYAVINPKNPEDNYPFRYLTGVGVAFKLVQGLFKKRYHAELVSASQKPDPETSSGWSKVIAGWEKWLLDLVAIGTVADLQPLTGENRIIVSFGLKVLAKTKWPGLKALLETARLNRSDRSDRTDKSDRSNKAEKIDTFTLGFIIAPRINAAGRIKHADIAFKLLICEDEAEAQKLATELNHLNTHRQQLTEQILSEAKEQIQLIENKKILLAAGSNWPKGVVGLVAGKLVEEYGRPVLVLDKGEIVATGSARSISNFDIVAALTHAKDLLTKYGGHTQAAGFSLVTENIPALHQKLLEYAETLDEETLGPELIIDDKIEEQDLHIETYDWVCKLAPFGFGNHKPRFITEGLEILEIRLVGAQGQHLKLKLRIGGKILDAIGFNQAFRANSLAVSKKIDLVYELECNEWNGYRDLQLKIIDLKLSSPT